MTQHGITGKFYKVLRDMYSNSFAYIKLSGHLSKRFRISKGTEQGHPLSPDQFKIFLSDLSKLLEFSNCPELSKTQISHLLWADDLIMLSLSPETCQAQLDILGKFCEDWGIEVNEMKTQVMIFGQNKKQLLSNDVSFKLQNKSLKVVDSYCYLGIVLHDSGELRTAQSTMKTKVMRAFFDLKRTVIRSKLSFKALTTLFDSLIKPIVLYGAPIWTPESATNKSIVRYLKFKPNNVLNFIAKINRTPSEKVHLSFLKWALGVHKKTSNVGVWGETGRYPLIYQSIRQTLNYYKHLLKAPKNSLVSAALKEQKLLKLPWFKNIEPLLKLDEIFHLDHVSAHRTFKKPIKYNPKNELNNVPARYKPVLDQVQELQKSQPMSSNFFRTRTIEKILNNHFVECWEYEKSQSPKLSFYHLHKQKFAREAYLNDTKGFSRRYNTTQLRISAHDLEIERGRYANVPRDERICTWCNTSMGAKIVEDESHMLYECDMYEDIRAKLITRLNRSPPIQNTHPNNPELTRFIDQLI